jgi:hypothetical protein
VNAPEGRDRRVNARQLHGDQTAQQPAPACGPVTLVSDPRDIDVERRELRDDFVRELVPRPIVFNNGRDLRLHEVAHALDDRPLFWIEQVSDFVEVAIHEGRGVRSFFCASPIGQGVVHLVLLLCCPVVELCFPLACSDNCIKSAVSTLCEAQGAAQLRRAPAARMSAVLLFAPGATHAVAQLG